MVRFLALLATLVAVNACNAGPLQWSDAETWSATDQGGLCVRDVVTDSWSADACGVLNARFAMQRMGRSVSGRAVTLGIDTCLAALRADDSVTPVTCVLPEVRRTRDDGSWTNYAITLTAARATITRESWRVSTVLTWTVGGVVSRSVGDSYPIRAVLPTYSTLLPVR